MAEHEPPADLLDKLVDCIASTCGRCNGRGQESWQRPDGRGREDWPCVRCKGSGKTTDVVLLRRALTALAEWADGALIDPSTWTRVRAEEYVNGVELCIVHDEVKVETHDPSGGCAEAWGADCVTVSLYTLDPPLTREDPESPPAAP